jgi:hypothetical protein
MVADAPRQQESKDEEIDQCLTHIGMGLPQRVHARDNGSKIDRAVQAFSVSAQTALHGALKVSALQADSLISDFI